MPEKNEEAKQCCICGKDLFIEDESPNGGMHIWCDPDYEDDEDDSNKD